MGREPEKPRLTATHLDVRPASLLDVEIFEPAIRDADRLEIDAASGQTVEEALTEGIENSRPCYAAFWKGKPLCLYGVVPESLPGDPEQFGRIWMLGTPLIEEMGIGFLRVSRGWVDKLMERYDGVGNAVDTRNEVHIKWLLWVGFEFLPAVPMGPFSLPFIPFYRCNVLAN